MCLISRIYHSIISLIGGVFLKGGTFTASGIQIALAIIVPSYLGYGVGGTRIAWYTGEQVDRCWIPIICYNLP